MFVIYLVGRIYGELNTHKDFITISSEGIQYRETPSFQMGWLPANRSYNFDQIRSVDMVSAKKLFNPDAETFGILLHFHQGRSQLIGTRLEQKQLMEIAFAMKGSVMLTGSLKRILGDDVTLKDVVDTAKGIWNSFTKKRGENTDG